ncbi:toll receptor 4 [Biomphalaria glabrata]|nr:toll receptor 4 [Biomphalaria glabrata]
MIPLTLVFVGLPLCSVAAFSLPDFLEPLDNDDESSCHPNYCEVLNTCVSTETCVSFGCNLTTCISHNDFFTVNSSEILTSTTVRKDHHCANVSDSDCPDPIFCPALVHCECQPQWVGPFCNVPCTLPCVNGECKMDIDPENKSRQIFYCNCQPSWTGMYCHDEFEDPGQENSRRVRIMAGVLAGSLILALIIVIVIPVVLWRLRVIFVLRLVYYFKSYDNSDDKLYDVYISMTETSNAEKFVYKELRPKLEDLGFSMYIQARDSSPGEVLSESIVHAVEKSRCTIMIITPDYIKNEWSRFEYLIAQHETLKLNQKIIPIILEQVDQTNMDKALKHIIYSVKCLKHPYMKLVQSLEPNPKKSCVNSVSSWHLQMEGGRKNYYDMMSIQDQEIEKASEKFWKRLELTLPKKKKLEKESS